MTSQTASRVDKFLAQKTSQPSPQRGNLIFALDATASREPTWDAACQLQAQMFKEVSSIGALMMQLVYYRGPRDFGGECRASRWIDNPLELASLMSKIRCSSGHTQIDKVLHHTRQEASRRKIGALVFVGDAVEESPDRLFQAAAPLGALSVPAFMLQEGNDPDAQKAFQDVAKATDGAYQRFNQGGIAQLAELLRAVALFSVGGRTALQHGSDAAKRLLSQMPPPS